jgi:hypothetical protein
MATGDDDDFLDEEPADIFISFPPEVQNAIEQVRKYCDVEAAYMFQSVNFAMSQSAA